jgi:hypothetical protein
MLPVIPPPATIDGARVLWWAWAGEEPFGFCGDVPVYGFAVCRYESGTRYRFSCDENWETVNDAVHQDEAEAKTAIPANYLTAVDRDCWYDRGK